MIRAAVSAHLFLFLIGPIDEQGLADQLDEQTSAAAGYLLGRLMLCQFVGIDELHLN